MDFVKMHGLGNDFIMLDCLNKTDGTEERNSKTEDALNREQVQRLCDRHCGIGADGVICILPSVCADFRMKLYNADGSTAQMCGNGIRCLGKYVYDHGRTKKINLQIETGAGVRQLMLYKEADRISTVQVDMGTPEFVPKHIPVRFSYTCVSVGNPHCVIFVKNMEELKQFRLEKYGAKLEHHPAFPEGTNMEVAWIQTADCIHLRVWERGCGETKACGTGACAVAAAAMRMGKCGFSVKMHLPGGELRVDYGRRNRHLYLIGPTEEVFTGTVH